MLERIPLGPARRPIGRSYTLRRIARRLGLWKPPNLRPQPPDRPLGVKLELTYRCNLRCSFCYTDSPRRTVEGALDLSDEDWRRIADEAVDLGVIEAVLTGGEPFLRRDLLLELLGRLDAAGVGTTLNTNGWFVDREQAAALAEVKGLHVHVSVDGPTAALHDAARGVPGSWRRAVTAIHHLLEHGVTTHAIQVVTPENEDNVEEFLELMWLLGVPSVRLTPVIEIGAAARDGEWGVDAEALRRLGDRFRRRSGGEMRVTVYQDSAAALAARDDIAPASMLVRPNGAVLLESLQPFAYGNAVRDDLAACWRNVVEHWRDERVSRWARSLRGAGDLASAEVVPYLSEEPPAAGAGAEEADGQGGAEAASRAADTTPAREEHRDDPLPAPAASADADGDPESARELVRDLALSRQYKRRPVREGGGEEAVVRVAADGRVFRLNRSATVALRALDGGTAADAVAALAGAYPGVERARLERDALGSIRTLQGRGIVQPARGRRAIPLVDGGTPDLPGVEPGGA